MKNITEKAPGKMMLAGEWSIMEPGNWCLVAAVDQYIYATISAHDTHCIHLADMDIQVRCTVQQGQFLWSKNDDRLTFVQTALTITLRYAIELGATIRPFLLTIHADTYLAVNIKYGLGGSAAVTVAATKAILSFYNVPYDQEILFKLSAIAHLQAQQGKGSCFDIAASSSMTTIAYRSFDCAWLTYQLTINSSLRQLIVMQWPLLEIIPSPIPEPWQLHIGWTGQSASTTACIDTVFAWKYNHLEQWSTITQQINDSVIGLIHAFEYKNNAVVVASISKNRSLLALLSKQTAVTLETDNLHTLIETAQQCGAASKFSGAGGGDCGIALCPNKSIAQKVKTNWANHGIKAIDVHPL